MLKDIHRVLRLLRHKYGEMIQLSLFADGSGGFEINDQYGEIIETVARWSNLNEAEEVIQKLVSGLEVEIKLEQISMKS